MTRLRFLLITLATVAVMGASAFIAPTGMAEVQPVSVCR